jgi:PAS domain S-box-containing protein
VTHISLSSSRQTSDANERPHDSAADPHDLLFRYTDALYRADSIEEVYEAALDAICEGLNTVRAAVLRHDGDGHMRFVASRGLSEGYRAAIEGHSPWRADEPNPALICIEDIALSTEPEEVKAAIAGEKICGLAFIPLMMKGALAGKFMVYYDGPALFTERNKELALMISRQMGFALEREAGDSNARRLAAIVDSSQDAIISKSLNGIIRTWNKSAERVFGYTADEIIGQSIMLLFPQDLVAEEGEILAKIAAGERIQSYETVRRCKDGHLVDVSLTVSPLKNSRGIVIGASKIARDVTERRRAEDRQALLLREMEHRVKNLFALAASLVQLSARTAETPNALAQSVVARLSTLSRAHSLTMAGSLSAEQQPSSGLHALIGAILQPFRETEGDGSIVITGEDGELGAEQVTPLALLLYELATNAVKYGGLSVPTASVTIRSRSTPEGLTIEWKERGGPPVGEISTGFGGKLIAATARQLGEAHHHWDADGLRVEIILEKR